MCCMFSEVRIKRDAKFDVKFFNIICFRCNLKFSVLKLKLLFALNVKIIYTLYKFEMTSVGIRTLIFSKHLSCCSEAAVLCNYYLFSI